MSTFNIPSDTGEIRQPPRGDVFGELWATFGMDLYSSLGKMKVSKRLSPTLSTTKTSNEDIQAFCLYSGSTYAFADSSRRHVIASYRNPRLSGNWTTTEGSLDIGDETDAVVFDGKMLVSTGTDIASTTNGSSYDVDWWTDVVSGTALTVSKPHIMDVSRIGQETLFVTDGNKVRYYNSTAGHSLVTLPTQLTACTLCTDYKATWVGTYSSDGNAYMYEVYIGDNIGGTTLARNAYRIDGTAVLSSEVIDGTPYIVTDKGLIQSFNGVAFVTVGAFPFAFKGVTIDGMSLGAIDDENNKRAIHPKGMRRDGRSLLININTNNELIDDLASNPDDNDDEFSNVVVDERSSSGIWEFDTETKQLTHLAPLQADTDTKGFHRQQRSGPILVIDNQYSRFLTTGRVLSTRTDLLADDPNSTPFGYFITKEINSQTIQDAWEKLAIKHSDLADGEFITIKYRTSKVVGLPKYANINWLDSTSFTTTDDLSAVAEGHEVEIIDGYGAGSVAHVSSISNSNNTYTVQVDTAIGSGGQSHYARFQNWQLAGAEDLTNTQIVGSDLASGWVQFKVVLVGNIEIRQLFNKGTSKTEM